MKPEKIQRLAEVEFCLRSYFDTHISPTMEAVKSDLDQKQMKEACEYSTSLPGILRSMATPMTCMQDNTMQYLRLTGEWNSKTVEDYIDMCRNKIISSKPLQNDVVRLAGEWRSAIIDEIGMAKYDEMSSKMGTDLAFAYINYRVEDLMIEKMVKDQMPKSSAEYIIRKGVEGSLLGLGSTLLKSPLQEEIDRRGEAAYSPSKTEKVAGNALSFGTDVMTTGGFSSWGALTRLAGVEIVFGAMGNYLDGKDKGKTMTVEECISKSIFNSPTNVFDEIRKKSFDVTSYENKYVLGVNERLEQKMGIMTKEPFWKSWTGFFRTSNPFTGFTDSGKSMQNSGTLSENTTSRANVPLVIAPGYEELYLAEIAENEKRKRDGENNRTKKSIGNNVTVEINTPEQESKTVEQKEENEEKVTNESGWGGILSTLGLDSIGEIGKNLGYVISMLPDMLVGLFTGKTKSIGLKDNMLPIASILLGMFIKNPILKMVLVGMGGLNLLNKAGHEAIERRQPDHRHNRYKMYEDEVLNPRISEPAIKGNILIATIDRVPCSVRLSDSVIEAYNTGALPLNTLANAILARNDEMNRSASENYQNTEIGMNENVYRPTITR